MVSQGYCSGEVRIVFVTCVLVRLGSYLLHGLGRRIHREDFLLNFSSVLISDQSGFWLGQIVATVTTLNTQKLVAK